MSNKRKYSSELRATRAAETRSRIQSAAMKLLKETGFEETTVQAIATEAEVSAQTVYSVFGSKAAIIVSMLDRLEEQAGHGELVPALMSAQGPREQLGIFTAWVVRFFENAADVFSIVLQSLERPEFKNIHKTGDGRRLGGCETLAGEWYRAGALRDGIDAESAAAQLWLMTSLETYLHSTTTLGWSPSEHETWVRESLERLLFK